MRKINKLKSINNLLIDLIKEYVSCAEYSCSLLNSIYQGSETLLYAWKVLKLIPKEGQIGEIYYQFHGRGCYFEYPNDSIDIEFGPEGSRCDGFNFFRINDFLKYRQARFNEIRDEQFLRRAFADLSNQGLIVKHPLEPESDLYYLKDKLL